MLTERHWVIGGLISVATTVLIFGFIVVTQPRGAGAAADDRPSLVAAGATPTSSTAPKETAATTKANAGTDVGKSAGTEKASAADTASKTTAKSRSKKSGSEGKPKGRKAARTAKHGNDGPGPGRIQFGQTYTGKATFYGATGAGNCSFEASSDLMVGAMNQQDYENSQACGAHLAVTGPNGRVTIRIVDRCPECPPGAIDLSQQAFAKIAPVSAGRVSISWKLLSPGGLGPVSYRYKTGSSQFWCGVQVRNHRNPVRSVQLKSGNSWKTLDRKDFNYFISDGGSGCGGAIRVTDIYGGQITDTGIRIAPDQTQSGKSQFPAP